MESSLRDLPFLALSQEHPELRLALLSQANRREEFSLHLGQSECLIIYFIFRFLQTLLAPIYKTSIFFHIYFSPLSVISSPRVLPGPGLPGSSGANFGIRPLGGAPPTSSSASLSVPKPTSSTLAPNLSPAGAPLRLAGPAAGVSSSAGSSIPPPHSSSTSSIPPTSNSDILRSHLDSRFLPSGPGGGGAGGGVPPPPNAGATPGPPGAIVPPPPQSLMGTTIPPPGSTGPGASSLLSSSLVSAGIISDPFRVIFHSILIDSLFFPCLR